MTYPKITYCIITYNEEKNIADCIESILDQDYPKDKIEIILVDDNSTDRTVEIAKQFPVKIMFNGKKDADLSMTMGLKAATGEFYNGIGADMRLRGKDWFKKMVKPLMENPDMAMAITRYYSHPDESLVTKYLNLDPFQRDLVYQFFTTDIEDVIYEKRDGYYLCRYTSDKIPPQVHGLYRVSILRDKILKQQKIWYDMGNLVLLVRDGFTKVGYVPDAGMYHFHAESLSHLLHKRARNIERSYLRYLNKEETSEGHYQYVDISTVGGVLKAMVLVLAANLLIPFFLLSLYRIFRHGRILYLLEAPITLLLVDTILLAFLGDSRGRALVKEKLSNLN